MNEEPPLGERFSQVYLQRGLPAKDSLRARFRIGAFIKNYRSETREKIATAIGRRLGVPASAYHLGDFTQKCDLRDLLDLVSVVQSVLGDGSSFVSDVNAIFREENLGYIADPKGGVRYFKDEEFERSRMALVAGIGLPRYTAAREAYEDAHAALVGGSPDSLTAVRRAFDAVENVFKMMTGEARLGSSEVGKRLKPRLAELPGRAADASNRLAESFSDWINACHQYRHAEGVPEPEPPPMDLALALISSAATYLRWLVGMDSASASA